MSDRMSFEDRVVLAVVEALRGTLHRWVRAVSVDVDEPAGSACVFFASGEQATDIDAGIDEFSARLRDQTSSWLEHSTDHWIGHSLADWPGIDARTVVSMREALPGKGISSETEFAVLTTISLQAALAGSFGPELWGVSFRSDASTRVAEVYLAFEGGPGRVDRYELEELESSLDNSSDDTWWRIHVWVGDRADFAEWPGHDLRRVYLQRRVDAAAPDDFED